jgi:hypothetical protein
VRGMVGWDAMIHLVPSEGRVLGETTPGASAR